MKTIVHIFKKTLLTEQGRELNPDDDPQEELESSSYFTTTHGHILNILFDIACSKVVAENEEYDRATRCTYKNNIHFTPNFPNMYRLFENQAGSILNLAEECVTILMRKAPETVHVDREIVLIHPYL